MQPEIPPLPAGLPNDWVFDRDLACPQCRYNLRMLRNPRCPECGVGFRWQTLLAIGCPRCGNSLEMEDGGECLKCGLELDWPRLLGDADPGQLEKFEYTKQPVRAAVKTAFAVLLPRRFWRSIRLESPPAEARLRRLRRASILMCIIGVVATFLVNWRPWTPYTYYFPANYLIQLIMRYVMLLGALLAIPLTTYLALPLFTPTLSRFRIRRVQFVRYSAYSSLILLWYGLMLVGFSIVREAVNLSGPSRLGYSTLVWSANILRILTFAALVCWLRFLYVALHDYLRLNRANSWALLLSTQVIGLIIAVLIELQFTIVVGILTG